jgi:hypothetical protein
MEVTGQLNALADLPPTKNTAVHREYVVDCMNFMGEGEVHPITCHEGTQEE